jgi:hypothetical protein
MPCMLLALAERKAKLTERQIHHPQVLAEAGEQVPSIRSCLESQLPLAIHQFSLVFGGVTTK